MPKEVRTLSTLDDSPVGLQEFLDRSAEREHIIPPPMPRYGFEVMAPTNSVIRPL